MPDIGFHPARVKAVVFDVDGTLYLQGPVRRAMLLRLLRAAAVNPVAGWRTLRTLSAYRRAQEHLRTDFSGDVAAAQIALVCERTGGDPAAVVACIERWMEQEPLTLLRQFRAAGVVECLQACQAHGLRLAVLSDYPADAKLRALGLADLFDVVLCAQSPEIGAFKPHPRGLQVAVQRLGVDRDECLYVGDRADVDAAAAAAAGIPAVIVTRATASAPGGHMIVSGYPQLQALLVGHREVADARARDFHRVA